MEAVTIQRTVEEVTLVSTISLVHEFAKTSVILKKLNKVINSSLKNKVSNMDYDYSKLYKDDEAAEQMMNQESLRQLISALHDRLYKAIKKLSPDDKATLYGIVSSHVTEYESRLTTITEVIEVSCDQLRETDKSETELREEIIGRINSYSSVKEELKYHAETYLALKHYIGGLTNASRFKK